MYEEIRGRCLAAILDSDREFANSIIDEWAQINVYECLDVNADFLYSVLVNQFYFKSNIVID